MWIETQMKKRRHLMCANNSFASNGECGLKHDDAGTRRRISGKFIRQQWRMWIETRTYYVTGSEFAPIHSPAMANVD